MTRSLLVALALAGCSYSDDKALRAYDLALEPARVLMAEVAREQPRLAERNSADRLRIEIEQRYLPLLRAVLAKLGDAAPNEPTIAAIHKDLVGLWRDYYELFEELGEDLSAASLDEKRAHLAADLVKLRERWAAWNAAAEGLHETITGWRP